MAEPELGSEEKRSRKWRWVIPAIALIALLGAVSLLIAHREQPQFMWLTERQALESMRRRWTDKFMQQVRKWLSGPRTKMPARTGPYVEFDSNLIRVPDGTDASKIVGTAIATNAAGDRVWVLSSQDFESMPERVAKELHLAMGPSDALLNRISLPQLLTFHTSKVTAPNRAPARINQNARWVATASGGRSGIFGDGQVVELSPMMVSGGIRVTVGFNSWYQEPAVSNLTTSTTNAPIYCRALVPNEGAIVLSGHSGNDGRSTNYLLVIRASAKDIYGKPLRLK